MSGLSPAGDLLESMIEDYLVIHGPHLTDAEAARRLSRTPRTIQRYKTILRQRGLLALPDPGPVLRPGVTEPGWCMCGCGRRTRRAGTSGSAQGSNGGWNRYVVGHTSRSGAARPGLRQAEAAS